MQSWIMRAVLLLVTKKTEKTRKRGLSKDQTCVCTGIEREGISCIEATNMGRPSKEDIERFITHVRGRNLCLDRFP